MPDNSNLSRAKRNKDDEYYTRLSDIELELDCYISKFKDKRVYCPCDDHRSSKFASYFIANFNSLGLEELVTTGYGCNRYLRLKRNGRHVLPLVGNGDFRSTACVKLMQRCDIVVTNPPFSLISKFIKQLISHSVDFLIVAPYTSFLYKRVLPFVASGYIKTGIHGILSFDRPDGTSKDLGNVGWMTTLSSDRSRPLLELTKDYRIDKFDRYDNFDAINVNSFRDIPRNYYGYIGVPISLLVHINTDQFKIHPIRNGFDGLGFMSNGRPVFRRVVISAR